MSRHDKEPDLELIEGEPDDYKRTRATHPTARGRGEPVKFVLEAIEQGYGVEDEGPGTRMPMPRKIGRRSLFEIARELDEKDDSQ